MQPMLKVPDDSISQLQVVCVEHRIKQDIERQDLALLYMVAHLPAYRPARMQQPHALLDHLLFRDERYALSDFLVS